MEKASSAGSRMAPQQCAQHARATPAATSDQQHPQHAQRQIEAADELGVGDEDARALRGDGRGQRREDREGRQHHHIARHLQHDRGDLLDQREHRGRAVVERRHRGADEAREHHDLQDLVVGHRLDDRARHQVGDEVGERAGRAAVGASPDCATEETPGPTPGWSTCTMTRPSVSETSEAKMNQPMALAPTRPTAAASSMCAMPATRVENTSGAMIILIRRRKMVVTMPSEPVTDAILMRQGQASRAGTRPRRCRRSCPATRRSVKVRFILAALERFSKTSKADMAALGGGHHEHVGLRGDGWPGQARP